jgi:hypothetical protein
MGFFIYVALKVSDLRVLLFSFGGVGTGVIIAWLISIWCVYTSKKDSIKWYMNYYGSFNEPKSKVKKVRKEKLKELNELLPEAKKRTNKVLRLIPYAALTFFIAAILPSTREVAMIYVIPKVYNNEDMKEIPANVAKLANEGLEELIKRIPKGR